MTSKYLLVAALAACTLAGCKNASDSAAEDETPRVHAPPITAEQHQKEINDNPNLSPAVKKVLGGGGH